MRVVPGEVKNFRPTQRLANVFGASRARPASHAVTANDVDYPFPRKAALKPQSPAAGTSKPQEARKGVTGFVGCLVMISNQEGRLVTVVRGPHETPRQNARWVDALLAPYLDRHLRVQIMIAHLRALPMVRPEAMDVSVCSTMPDGLSEGETVCVG